MRIKGPTLEEHVLARAHTHTHRRMIAHTVHVLKETEKPQGFVNKVM